MKIICLTFVILLLLGITSETQAKLLGPLGNLLADVTGRIFDILSLRKIKVISGGIIATTPDESQDFTDVELKPKGRAKRSTYHSAEELPDIHAECVKATPKLDKRVTRNKKPT